MSNDHIARAWKDEEYRNSLSAEERAALPENPAGAIELNSDELTNVAAGFDPISGVPSLEDLGYTKGTSACDPPTKFEIQCESSGGRGGLDSLRG